MNGYTLTRRWFNWNFENTRKARPIHGILYMWCIEKSNRLGWMQEFQLPSDEAAAACGAADRETILKAVADLEEWGFIKVIQEAKNRYTARWIKILDPEFDLSCNLDSAIMLHPKKSDAIKEYLPKKPDSIPVATTGAIPVATPTNIINNKTNKPQTIKHINIDFEFFWNLYDKKVNKKTCLDLWMNLNEHDKTAIIDYLPAYTSSTPDKTFRKDPERFIKKRAWEDEIITPHKGKIIPFNQEEMNYDQPLK